MTAWLSVCFRLLLQFARAKYSDKCILKRKHCSNSIAFGVRMTHMSNHKTTVCKNTHTYSHTHDPLFIKNAQNHECISMLFSSFMLRFFFPTRKLVQNYVMTKICLPFQLCTCLRAGFIVSDEIKAILIKWTHFKLIEAKKKVLTKI